MRCSARRAKQRLPTYHRKAVSLNDHGTVTTDHTGHCTRVREDLPVRHIKEKNHQIWGREQTCPATKIHQTLASGRCPEGEFLQKGIHLHQLHHCEGFSIDHPCHRHHLHLRDSIFIPCRCNPRTFSCRFICVLIHHFNTIIMMFTAFMCE